MLTHLVIFWTARRTSVWEYIVVLSLHGRSDREPASAQLRQLWVVFAFVEELHQEFQRVRVVLW
jgi:hypothetical protein